MQKGNPRTKEKSWASEFKERNPEREIRTPNLSSCLVRCFRGLNEGSVSKVVKCYRHEDMTSDTLWVSATVNGSASGQHAQPLELPIPPCFLSFCAPSRSPARNCGQLLPTSWKNAPMIPQPQIELPPQPPRGSKDLPPQVTMLLGPLLTLDWTAWSCTGRGEREREQVQDVSCTGGGMGG